MRWRCGGRRRRLHRAAARSLHDDSLSLGCKARFAGNKRAVAIFASRALASGIVAAQWPKKFLPALAVRTTTLPSRHSDQYRARASSSSHAVDQTSRRRARRARQQWACAARFHRPRVRSAAYSMQMPRCARRASQSACADERRSARWRGGSMRQQGGRRGHVALPR